MNACFVFGRFTSFYRCAVKYGGRPRQGRPNLGIITFQASVPAPGKSRCRACRRDISACPEMRIWSPMKIVIVVPTYNEAENIPLLVEQVARTVPEADLMLMDDNSPDGTADVAERLFAARPEYGHHRVVR